MRLLTVLCLAAVCKFRPANLTGKSSNLFQRCSPRFQPIHFRDPLINPHRLDDVPLQKIPLAHAVHLVVMLAAERQRPHADVTDLPAVCLHMIDMMQLRFPAADDAPLFHEARPCVLGQILGKLVHRLAARHVVQQAELDEVRDVEPCRRPVTVGKTERLSLDARLDLTKHQLRYLFHALGGRVTPPLGDTANQHISFLPLLRRDCPRVGELHRSDFVRPSNLFPLPLRRDGNEEPEALLRLLRERPCRQHQKGIDSLGT